MRYLTVDGMMSGTGVRDTQEGGYIDLDQLNISAKLKEHIQKWLLKYRDEFYRGYNNLDAVKILDGEGIKIAKLLSEDLPDSKIEYYSDAKTERIYFKT